MKNKAFLVVGMVLILVLAGLAGCSAETATAAETQAQPVNVAVNSQQTGIWVNGEGKVSVTPDLAILSLGVTSTQPTVAEAQSLASEAMDKVMAALTSAGIADKDIQTQRYRIQQETRWDDDTDLEVVTGYSVTNTVIAKIRNLDNVGTVIDAVVVAGGDLIRINDIDFTVEKPEQYYEQAREMAMADAKAKAEQIARLSGATLGKVTYVVEGSVSEPITIAVPTAVYKSEAMSAGAGTSISAGEMYVTLNVQVAYSIQ